jgi:hypothetical protein
MKVRVEIQKVAEGLNRSHRSGNGVIGGDALTQICIEHPPDTPAQFRQQRPVEQKKEPQPLGDAENPLPVGHALQHAFAHIFPENHHPFLMAGWAKRAAFTGKRQKILMVAFFADHPGKPAVQISAFQITQHHLQHIGTPKPVSCGIPVVPYHFQVFAMLLNTKAEGRFGGLDRLVVYF